MRWSALLRSSALVLQSPGAPADDSVARPVFDYHLHGEDWSVGQCGSRKRQSPIDIPAGQAKSAAQGTLAYDYEPITFPFKVQNNGHGIAADLSDNGVGGLTLDGSVFTLKTITVHARSEHTRAGSKFPVEVHLVHQRYDGDALAVVAFWFDSPVLPRVPYGESAGSGDAPPDPRLAFFANPPTEMNTVMAEASELNPMDFNAWFGQERFYTYEGSLTVPPCSEIVQWFVREKPVPASNAQISSLFHALFHMEFDIGNARAVMPLMDREIRVVTAEQAEPVAEGSGQGPEKGEYVYPPTREFRGVEAGVEAMQAVKENTRKLADLDARIKAAAAAQPKALAGWLPPMTPDSPDGYLAGVKGAGVPVPDISAAWRSRVS